MPSQSLYRKWRSQTFSDLMGQEAVVRTLLNAVRDGRLSHAYLFCGPRGTGKTSAARLLAKAINCERPRDGEPCGECLSCQEIATGRSPDVIEIDAASNNGVDDVRELRKTVGTMSAGGRSRVYVIDEAHMLSPQAWNALLKTLEEPPPHVIFVFATTEAHKMLPTVVSRCQRFDFRRIRMAVIVARLRHVAQGEGLELEPAAADLLARAAQGGLRDALSLLDQAVAFCGQRIDAAGARTMLGLADVGALRRMIAAIADDDAAAALDLLDSLVKGGADLRQINGQLAEEWRGLLLARAGADLTTTLDVTAEEARELGELAARFSLDELMACARVFARNEAPPKGLPVPQLAVELALLECLSVRRGVTVSTAAPAAPRPARAESAPQTDATPARARPAVASSHQPMELDLAAIDDGTWVGPTNGANGSHSEPTPASAARAAAPQEQLPRERGRRAASPAEAETPPHAAEAETPPHVAAPTPTDDSGRDWVAEAQESWPLIRKLCRQKPPMGAVVGGLLSAVDPIRCEPGAPPTLVLRAKFDVHVSKLRDQGMRQIIEWALEQALGVSLRVQVVGAGEATRGAAPARKSPVPREASEEPASLDSGVSAAQSNPAPHVYERKAPLRAQAPAAASAVVSDGADGGVAGAGNGGARAGHGEVRERPAAKPRRSAERVEKAAREDPVVKEFARMLKTEVAEVRALDADDEPDE